VGPFMGRSSTLPFDVLSNLLISGAINGPWQVDLLSQIPTNPDTLADCVICDFPGYAPVQLYGPIVLPDDPANNQAIPCGPHHFESTAPGGTHHLAIGYVVSDALGSVLWWWTSSISYDFNAVGYLDVTFQIYGHYDYP